MRPRPRLVAAHDELLEEPSVFSLLEVRVADLEEEDVESKASLPNSLPLRSTELADSRQEKPEPAEDSDGLAEDEADEESEEITIGSSSRSGRRISSSQASTCIGVTQVSWSGCSTGSGSSTGSPDGWYSGELGAQK